MDKDTLNSELKCQQNLKISSLNIQGLKKHCDGVVFKEYCKQFDIIACYETWQTSENDFANFIDGYENFDSMREKGRRAVRGSGGVTVFVKYWIIQSGSGVQRIFNHFSECVVLLFKAGSFNRNQDLIMLFTYVAPENSSIYTEEDDGLILLHEKLSEILIHYPTAELFVAGDLNARISTLQDYIPFDDLDFVFGETDYPTDPFDMPRNSKDETYNRFGISLLDLCCSINIHILNGRMFDDKNGEITCTSNNGSSVVDYMLASSSLFNSILHFCISCEDFSDHFPLHCTLELSKAGQNTDPFEFILNENKWTRFKWNENLKHSFAQHFSEIFSHFKNKMTRENKPALSYLTDFINLFKEAGKCIQVKYKKANNSRNKQPPWWDNECQTAKLKKIDLIRKFRRTNSGLDLHKAAKARFKNVCRSKRLKYEKEKRFELLNACRNPRSYWKIIKQNCNGKSPLKDYISPGDWVRYFQNLLNMDVDFENEHLLQNITQDHDCNDLDRPISNAEIISSIKSINSNR